MIGSDAEPGVEARPGRTNNQLGAPIDLKALLTVFRRRLPLFGAVAAVIFVGTLAASLLLPPIYTATATIQIDPNQRASLDMEALMRGAPEGPSLDTEVAIMKSRTIAAEVVDRLDLTKDPEFNPPANSLAKLLGHGADTSEMQRDQTIAAVKKRMGVERDGTTYIINISFKSKNADRAESVANAVAEEYILFSLKSRVNSAAQRAKWLNERLGSLGQEVQSADSAVAQYRAQTGIAGGLSASGASMGTVTDQQITTITAALAGAESDAAAARSVAQSAHNQMSRGGVDSVAQVLNSPAITALRSQRAEVLRQQAEINSRYGPRHPEAIRVQQQLAGIDQQLNEEAARIVAGLDGDAQAAAARASALRGQLGGLQGKQASNSRLSVQANSLERQAEAKRTMYDQLAATAQQTSQQEKLDRTEGRIVSPAARPLQPTFPKKSLFAVLGLMLGGIVGLAAVFVAEALDSGVRTARDVESDLGLPYLASLPLLSAKQLKLGRNRTTWDFVIEKPMSGFSESLRTVRSALMLGEGETAGKVLALTSALPNEGKSFTAASLARIMAMSGDRTIIVDCDLRQNSLQGLLKTKPTAGLVEVLSGQATLQSAIVADTVTGLSILPLTATAFTARDVFNTEAMHKLVNELRQNYDRVIFDGPPVMAVADALALAQLADHVMLITRWARTPRDVIRIALNRLEQAGASIAGVIITMVDPSQPAGEGDPSYYYKSYKNYYLD